MKKMELVMAAALLLTLPHAFAEQTKGEKFEDGTADAKRELKKSGHRVEEFFCKEGDLECAAKKGKNRVLEAKDATIDKTKEVKNRVD